jgi:hypothetical protein
VQVNGALGGTEIRSRRTRRGPVAGRAGMAPWRRAQETVNLGVL